MEGHNLRLPERSHLKKITEYLFNGRYANINADVRIVHGTGNVVKYKAVIILLIIYYLYNNMQFQKLKIYFVIILGLEDWVVFKISHVLPEFSIMIYIYM